MTKPFMNVQLRAEQSRFSKLQQKTCADQVLMVIQVCIFLLLWPCASTCAKRRRAGFICRRAPSHDCNRQCRLSIRTWSCRSTSGLTMVVPERRLPDIGRGSPSGPWAWLNTSQTQWLAPGLMVRLIGNMDIRESSPAWMERCFLKLASVSKLTA